MVEPANYTSVSATPVVVPQVDTKSDEYEFRVIEGKLVSDNGDETLNWSATSLDGTNQTATTTMTATMTEGEELPKVAWIGFSANGHTEGNSAYTPFYEVVMAEQDKVFLDNDTYVQGAPGATYGEGTTLNMTPTFTAPHGHNPFGAFTPFKTETVTKYGGVDAFHGKTVAKDDATGNFYVPMDLEYTTFKFKDGADSMLSTLNSWFSSSGNSSLVEVLMISNPTQPNINDLSSLASSAFDSDSLSLKCGTTWNGDESDKTKMVFQYENGDGKCPFI